MLDACPNDNLYSHFRLHSGSSVFDLHGGYDALTYVPVILNSTHVFDLEVRK